jgi:hypothetical protein
VGRGEGGAGVTDREVCEEEDSYQEVFDYALLGGEAGVLCFLCCVVLCCVCVCVCV